VSNRRGLSAAVATFAIAGLMGMASSAAFAQDACTGRGKISKKVAKQIGAAQELFATKDWTAVLAKAQEADAVPIEKTEWEKFLINEFRALAYTNLKQYPEAAPALEASVASPCMEEAAKKDRLRVVTQVQYANKDWAKAIKYGDEAIKAGGDPELAIFIGNAYYAQNDYKNTQRILDELVTGQEAKGKKPEEQSIRILQSACLNLDDTACVVQQSERLVSHYPKLEYWQQVIGGMLRESKSDKQLLNILRLAEGAESLTKADEYNELGRLAVDQGLPGEAQMVLEAGERKGVFKTANEKARNARLLETAKKAAVLDKSTLDSQDARAKAKATGDSDIKLGAAYLSYNQPDKAIEALNRGIGKGGVKDGDEAAILLGIAYLRINNKEEAAKSFRNVKNDPMMTRIAKLWLLRTQA
jgi:hypothetical protein